ncbi:MAG TPA: thiamine pyrophosphate-dependent enzyme, partial [Edaphobacter sp.]|nr:thiamine pyrophosphate-dependent enzyme [Edaphobacter sp.]
LTFKTLKQPQLVMTYLHRTDATRKQWSKALKQAAQLELPILFIVLPAPPDDKLDLCAMARRAGLPGIPVDANDVVALYRVAQESIGRARAGDGPVLMECIAGLPGSAPDAIAHMRDYLVSRRISTRQWAESAGKTLRKKIQARKKR